MSEADRIGLFAPMSIGRRTLANRLVVAPMTRLSATEDGEATPQMARYYAQFAHFGWGLVETEAVYIDDEQSQCRARQPGIATAAQREAWRRVVDAVHAEGATIVIQLQHAGALSEVGPSVAPSAIPPRSARPLPAPRALTRDQITRIQQHFAAAAVRAIEAGFDGVEVHGANGYLIDQFLTDYTNHRTDEYGGTVENRIRFAVETMRAVRRAVPATHPVGLRLSQHKTADPDYTWAGGEADACAIFRAVVDAGADFLHIGGRNEPSRAHDGRLLCALAKGATSAVVIANGGLEAPARARTLIAASEADLVSIARGALANADWPRRVAAGDPLRAFDPAMIRPTATLDNAEAWRRQQSDSQ